LDEFLEPILLESPTGSHRSNIDKIDKNHYFIFPVRTSSFALLVAVFLSFAFARTANATEPLRRGEMLMSALDSDVAAHAIMKRFAHRRSSLPLFLDVDQSSDIAPYVEAAFTLGLISVPEDRLARLGEPVTVLEAAQFLLRLRGVPIDPRGGQFAVAQAAIEHGLFPNPATVALAAPVTREEIAEYQQRMMTPSSPAASDPMPSVVSPSVPVPDILAPQPPEIAPPLPIPPPYEPPVMGPREGMRAVVLAAAPVTDGHVLQAYASGLDFAISIPALGIRDLPIFHPADPSSSESVLSVLHSGVGHLFSYPGEGGKVMIYGHSSSYRWDLSAFTRIFRQINKLKPGDDVYVMRGGHLFHYRVSRQETIAPNDGSPFNGVGEELLLYTCWPPDSIDTRLVIHADPVETVAVR
jgi:LPXTG-site transpeptidase (sortase) family protein